MPLFGRQRATRYDTANVTPRRRGWAMFSPYPQRNRTTNPNNTYPTTGGILKGRTNNDATMNPRRSRRIGRGGARANQAQRVPLVTKVKRTLGIQSRQPVYSTGPRGGGLFGNTPRRADQRNRGWFSRSGGQYRN